MAVERFAGQDAPRCFRHDDVAKNFMSAFILWLLLKKQLHGYGVIKIMQREGMPKAKAARIYPILGGLLAAGMLRSSRSVRGGKAAKMYSTTRAGRAALMSARKHFFTGLRREFFQSMLNGG